MKKNILVCVIIAATALSSTQSDAQTDEQAGGAEWWGPSGIDEGWHVRIPLTVTNPYDTVLQNAPVAAELDIGKALIEAGWTTTESGDTKILTGFAMDPNSIRVVEMTNFKPQDPRSPNDGRVVREVASTSQFGLLGRTTLGGSHDPERNPRITVFFQASGETRPDQDRHFYVYLDSKGNGAKASTEYPDHEAAPLEALHWITAGTELYGRIAEGEENIITVVGLHDQTTVAIEILEHGTYVQDGVTTIRGNPFTIDEGETIRASLGTGPQPVFRVTSEENPVSAFIRPIGFVPSHSGGLRGDEFTFHTDDGSAYVMNVGSQTATVTVDGHELRLDPGLQPTSVGGAHDACSSHTPNWIELDPASTVSVAGTNADLMVQLQPTHRTQVPSIDGAPTGTTFLATSMWSGQDCNQANGRDLFAWTSKAATLHVERLDSDVQVFPRGTEQAPRPSPQDLSPSVLGGPFNLAPSQPEHRDRPLVHRMTAPGYVYTGGPIETDGRPHIAGPLSGPKATHLQAYGPVTVIAPYPDTAITADVQYRQGSTTNSDNLGKGEFLSLQDSTTYGALQAATITSSKPIVAYPQDEPSGYLAGVPSFLDVQAGELEFRGRLISLQSQDGLDPVTLSMAPGETEIIPLTVSNHGRSLDGISPPESIEIEATSTGPWSTEIDRPAVTLDEGQSTTVNVRLTAPGTVPSGTLLKFTIRATSQDHPATNDTLEVAAFVRDTFGVGLWFLQADNGPKTLPIDAAPGTTAHFPVFIRNQGTQPETFQLDVESSTTRTEQRLRDLEGNEINAVHLEGGQSVALNLSVTSMDETDLTAFTTITAQGERIASSTDRITAIMRAHAPGDLDIRVDTPARSARDGTNATFIVEVMNKGEGSNTISLEVTADAPDDWVHPRLSIYDPITQDMLPLQGTLSLAPGESQQLIASQPVPHGASAGSLATLLVQGETNQDQRAQQEMTIAVKTRHELNVTAGPVQVVAGERQDVSYNITNLGNVDEFLEVLTSSLPSGWNATHPPAIALPVNETAQGVTAVAVPADARAGKRDVALRIQSADGHAVVLQTTLMVLPRPDIRIDAPSAVSTRPGTETEAKLTLHNDGNTPMTARVVQSDPWNAKTPDSVLIPTGATVLVPMTWQVPIEQEDGEQVQQVRFELSNETLTTPLIVSTSVHFDIGRPNFVITRASEALDGRVVEVRVANTGTRAAPVDVTLHDGDNILAAKHIPNLAAGNNLTLLFPVDGHGEREVRLDAANMVVEDDETDNAMRLPPKTGDKQSPGMPMYSALAVLAWLAVCRKREA